MRKLTEEMLRFSLRLPADVFTYLQIVSAEQGRSLNAQIVHLLRESLHMKEETNANRKRLAQ